MRQQPEPGQESVWDYPRPPSIEPTLRHIQIFVGSETIADSRRTLRLTETSHPPVYYIPPADLRLDLLQPAVGYSYCEWKGEAIYHTLVVGDRRTDQVAWSYPQPAAPYASLAGYLAFYPSKVDRCLVDGIEVVAQPGDFYGGWITPEIVGPFKGDPGSWGW